MSKTIYAYTGKNIYSYTGSSPKINGYPEYISINQSLFSEGLNFFVRSQGSPLPQMIGLSLEQVRELHTILGGYLERF